MIDQNTQSIGFLFTFMWGFMDGAVNTHTYQMLGFEFDTATDPFSVFASVQALGVVIFQLIQSYLDTDSETALQTYTGVVCLLGFFLSGTTFFFEYRYRVEEKNKERGTMIEHRLSALTLRNNENAL